MKPADERGEARSRRKDWVCRVCGEHITRRFHVDGVAFARDFDSAFCVYHDASDLEPEAEFVTAERAPVIEEDGDW